MNKLKTITSIFVFGITAFVYAQTPSSNENYVMTKQIFVEGKKTQSSLISLSSGQYAADINYFDGLGRLEQEVAHKASANSKDIIIPHAYDVFGREEKTYLSYVASGSLGQYQSNAITDLGSYRNSPTDTGISDAEGYPYGKAIFDNTPLNRVMKQGAAGVHWQPNSTIGNYNDNSVKFEYDANGKVSVFKFNGTNGGSVEYDGYYLRSELTKNTTLDEDNNETIIFSDKLDRTVMIRKVENGLYHDTYYIYDEFGRLNTVIQPEGVQQIKNQQGTSTAYANAIISATNGISFPYGNPNVIHTGTSFQESPGHIVYRTGGSVTLSPGFSFSSVDGGTFSVTNNDATIPTVDLTSILDDYAFQYEYDGRGRLVEKYVPSAGWTYMVYDNRNQLRLSQDPNQKSSGEWTFYKYDHFGREVQRGLWQGGNTRYWQQTQMNAETTNYENAWFPSLKHYSNNTIPTNITESNLISVNLYDDYDAFSGVYLFNSGASYDPDYLELPIGLLTGTETKILGTSTWLKSAVYYDEKYREIQLITDNHIGEYTRVSNQYNFAGWLEKTKTEHNHFISQLDVDIEEVFTYDHRGRMLTHTHSIDGATPVTVAEYDYNNLGELIEKDLHSGEQSLDYRYNVRGWLTRINDHGLTDGEGDLFGMNLYYNESSTLSGQTSLYNGNISAMRWSDNSGAGLGNDRGYNYFYDNMNRITAADHFDGTSDVDAFSVSGLSYDMNGNIAALKRHGKTTSSYMDDLSYTYSGNQLMKVGDAGTAEGFNNGNTSGDDYDYDDNGNMIQDLNKGITDIDYNHLNLPIKVTFDANNHIEYQYDAAGIKLQQKVTEGGSVVKTTDYVGGFIYEDDGNGSKLQLIQTAEGRVIPKGSNWDYQYHLKDHLGNARLTFSTTPENYTTVEDFEDTTSDFVDLRRHQNSNASSSGSYVSRLQSNQTGALVFVSLDKGDTVNISVKANYESAPSGNSFLGTAFSVLFSSFDGAFGSGAEGGGGVSANSTEFDDALSSMAGKGSTSSAPRAFLNYIRFDQDMNYVTAGFEQISTSALGVGTKETVILNDIIADRKGYLLAYLSNENQQPVNVHFDDFTIYHGKTNIVQSDDYYPFGLAFNGYQRTASTVNRFTYNGKEVDENTGWYDYGLRHYDPELGVWHTIDPSADTYHSLSPYNYVFNNPIRLNDPDGADPDDVIDEASRFIGTFYQLGGKNPDPNLMGAYDVFDGPALSMLQDVAVQYRDLTLAKDWKGIKQLDKQLGLQSGCSFGIDCSGLVATAFNADPDKLMNDLVSGTAEDQLLEFEIARNEGTGTVHNDFNDLQKADVVFRLNEEGTKAEHAMIATGEVKKDKLGHVKRIGTIQATGTKGRVRHKWVNVKNSKKIHVIGHTKRKTDPNIENDPEERM